jgi:hypothetical protein
LEKFVIDAYEASAVPAQNQAKANARGQQIPPESLGKAKIQDPGMSAEKERRRMKPDIRNLTSD